MSVIRVEEYTMKNSEKVLKVILKPTKNFPEGKNFFFTDDNDITRELIESYTWGLVRHNNIICVMTATHLVDSAKRVSLLFHQEYAYRVLSYYPDYIEHYNGLEIDNRDINLNVVSQQQNTRNKPTKGYTFEVNKNKSFRIKYVNYYKSSYISSYKIEPDALLAVYNLRQGFYSDYDYNFLEDRRNYIYLLDQECRGILSHKESSYIRAKELIESNPWYVYRYNLFDYCQAHNIVIPDFILDNQGFMVDPITKSKFCPY